MKKYWLKLADRFDARSPRERFTVFIGLTALILALAYVLAFAPALDRQQKAQRSIEESARLQAQLAEQEVALITASARDPDAEAMATIKHLNEEVARRRTELTSSQSQLATPEKMTSVLRDLIASQKGLELVSLRSGKSEDIFNPNASAPAAMAGIFRHGIEISVRGSYADLAAYVKQVEALPWKIRPESLVIKTETWPVSTMTLTLYTLSLERAWLSF